VGPSRQNPWASQEGLLPFRRTATVHLQHELPHEKHKLGLSVDCNPLVDSMEHARLVRPNDNGVESKNLLAQVEEVPRVRGCDKEARSYSGCLLRII
jgi:hypothetical protein